jgi:hypothetical protein
LILSFLRTCSFVSLFGVLSSVLQFLLFAASQCFITFSFKTSYDIFILYR